MKLVAFLKKWLSTLDHLFQRYRRWRKTRYCDKKIIRLEQEYQYLLGSSTTNSVARLSVVVSELGKFWNMKLRAEDKTELAKRDGSLDIWELQKTVNKVVHDGKKKMAKARSDEEIHAAFKEGIYKIKCLMNE